MSNLNLSYGLQALEGANLNIQTLSRTAGIIIANYTNLLSERVTIPTSTTNQQINIPITATKAVLLENVSSNNIILTVQFNVTGGVTFAIPAGGFIMFNISSNITSVFVTNTDTANAGTIIVTAGG